MKQAVTHKFVDTIPEEIKEGVLYVSIPYETVIHKCCCGCGNEVVTPISPSDWTIIFNGESISIEPSIGNWSFKCRSHYWITQNEVVWSAKWSNKRIAEVRVKDFADRVEYFADSKDTPKISQEFSTIDKRRKLSFWKRVFSNW